MCRNGSSATTHFEVRNSSEENSRLPELCVVGASIQTKAASPAPVGTGAGDAVVVLVELEQVLRAPRASRRPRRQTLPAACRVQPAAQALLGLYGSLWLDVPPGPAIAVLGTALYVMVASVSALTRPRPAPDMDQ